MRRPTLAAMVALLMLAPAAMNAAGLQSHTQPLTPGPLAPAFLPQAVNDGPWSNGGAPGSTEPHRTQGARLDPALGRTDAPRLQVFLHANDHATLGAFMSERAAPNDLDVLHRFAHLPVAAASLPRALLDSIVDDPRLTYVEDASIPIEYDLESTTRASRAKAVYAGGWSYPDAGAPGAPRIHDVLRDEMGRRITGHGIGVAVVDSGIDQTHPDLDDPGQVVANHIVTSQGITEGGPYTAGHAHGTHIAGIIVGDADADHRADHRGSAPGASIHGFSLAPAGQVLHPAIAFDWILEHGHEQEPPIRIVTNSWGCHSAACVTTAQERLHIRLAHQLVDAGYVVLFAAGNDGGKGFASHMNREAEGGPQGLIAVGNYDDDGFGFRDGCPAESSSRGAALDPSTWPDVLAPGVGTWSAHPLQPLSPADSRVPVVDRKPYTKLGGTSAATAHMAGIAALVLQSNPQLTPAQVELILEATAQPLACDEPTVRADPTHPWGPANHVQGHGLVDAYAAVQRALKPWREPGPRPALEALPDAWRWLRDGFEVTESLYIGTANDLTEAFPDASTPSITLLLPNQRRTLLSEPMQAPTTVEAAEANTWFGTAQECICIRFTKARVLHHLDHVLANGTVVPIDHDKAKTMFVHPALPTQRVVQFEFDAPVHLAPGDRLALTLESVVDGGSNTQSAEAHIILYRASRDTPSRLDLGRSVAPVPGTTAWCEVRQDCADIGDERTTERVHCEEGVPFRVEWEGPPGSRITLTCPGFQLDCTVPIPSVVETSTDADTHGRCSAEAFNPATKVGHKEGECRYWTTDGARAPGEGRCVGLMFREDED